MIAYQRQRVFHAPSCGLPRETLVDFGRAVAEAAKVDAEIVAVVANDLPRLIDLDEDRARDAAIDGLWQTLILAGALEATPMRGELLSYEAPTYYGMLVAVWEPWWTGPVC